ncbi:chromosome segregation protein SMC [bacterium 1XD8-76]|nr:chromosome segregation protein SMC [bacterium 1XD8-76]
MGTVKINKLEIENVKRVKAVKMEPSANGLTIIGGNNNQGKTSVLDAIAWALGGDKFRPSQAQNTESVIPPHLRVVLNNGLIVERKGKNSDLKVTDPEGNKAGQQLLNEFVEQLALNLPRFMEAGSKEKAETLLKIIGIGDRLHTLEQREQELFNDRRAIGRIADQKEKFAKEQVYYSDAPQDIISPSELIQKQQEILARNGENQRKRKRVEDYRRIADLLTQKIESIKEQLEKEQKKLEETNKSLEIAEKDARDLQDESTKELEESISNIEEINRKVRANLDKGKAEDDAREYRRQYDEFTTKLEDVRNQKEDLLNSAPLPLPELSVENGELIYKGQKWDNMSGSDRLKVSTAIVRKLNPRCGFVLLDKLEQMDMATLTEFGQWLESEGLQAIATRVSTGGECSILISDGYSYGQDDIPAEKENKKVTWKEGEF